MELEDSPQCEQEQALPQCWQGALLAWAHPCWPTLSLQCPQGLHPPEALVLARSRGTELPKSLLQKGEMKQSTKSSPSHHQTQLEGLVRPEKKRKISQRKRSNLMCYCSRRKSWCVWSPLLQHKLPRGKDALGFFNSCKI